MSHTSLVLVGLLLVAGCATSSAPTASDPHAKGEHRAGPRRRHDAPRGGSPVKGRTPTRPTRRTSLAWKPSIILPGHEPPPHAAGNFIVLVSSTEDSGAISTEDGFTVFVPEPRWKELLAALAGGRPFDVRASAGKLSFALAWTAGAPATSKSAAARPDDVVDVPPDVRYKAAPTSVNEAARRELTATFGAADDASMGALVSIFVAVGPGLWRSLEGMPDATSTGVPSTFMVPLGPDPKNAQQLEGRS